MIRRDAYVERLLQLAGNGNVKVVTGIRRCGKSYLLDRLLKRRLAERCRYDRHFAPVPSFGFAIIRLGEKT